MEAVKVTFSKFGRIQGNEWGTSDILNPEGKILGYIERIIEAEKIGSSRQDTYTVVGYTLCIFSDDKDDQTFTNLTVARDAARSFFKGTK